MLRTLTLALATALSLAGCSATTGPDFYQYNADGESEPSMADGSSVTPEQPFSTVIESGDATVEEN